MNRALAVTLAVAVLGCASNRRLVHRTKNRQDYYRDLSTCKARAGQGAGTGSDMQSAILYRQIVEECMYGEGWYWADAD
jgi:hypothetical protein